MADDLASEIAAFDALKDRLVTCHREVFPDPLHPRAVLIVPSLTLDPEVLATVRGAHHYEERMLCLLMLLALPTTRVIYVSSTPIPEQIIEYYLQLLPSIPHPHARRRLTLFSCEDASPRPLTEKILERPRLLGRIRAALGERAHAHMVCFNVTPIERRLAVALDCPVYGTDPAQAELGSKSGSRQEFRAAGVTLPDGAEGLRSEAEVADALLALKARNPGLRRAVVKLNEGFSGDGNAVFTYPDALDADAIVGQLARLDFVAEGMTWPVFRDKLGEMGGVVEVWLDAKESRSPSVQLRIDPSGRLEVVSTHDQVLGGATAQTFLGARFPADPVYRDEIRDAALRIGEELRSKGVCGRFSVDFMSLRTGSGWDHYAVEINLRKGGTTHPFLMLKFLTDGRYDTATGQFLTQDGRPRCYFATDNLEDPRYRGLLSEDLIDIAVRHGLHFNRATQTGVVFHLIGALSEFGKLGMVAVGADQAEADQLHADVVRVLDAEVAS